MPLTIRISMLISGCFMISELLLVLVKNSWSEKVEKRNDRGSLILLWIAITLGMTAGFMFAHGPHPAWTKPDYITAWTGILITLPGFVIRWISILQLKKGFTVNVSITESHMLKTDGLYGIVRHPSYLGLLLIITGEAVSMVNLISFVALTVPVLLALVYRISIEEKLLRSYFGDKYLEYSKKTKRLIPFIY